MPADGPPGVDEPGDVVAMDVDAPLGESEGIVHAQQSREHAGWLVLGMGVEVGERPAVQLLDPSGNLGRREVGQARAFTVGGPAPARRRTVPGRRTGAQRR